MNINECMNQIRDAVMYAKRENVVTAYNWNEALIDKVVVAFGVGKFLEDTHQRLFDRIDIKYLCDNDSEKWGKYFWGKRCISPEELKKIRNVYVVIVMGDPSGVEKQLHKMGIESISITEIHFSAYEKGKDCIWLEKALPMIEKALSCLGDDNSRTLFTKIFMNKIYLSKCKERYNTFVSDGMYFTNGFWDVGPNECLVDGGAYIGDTIDDYIHVTDGKFEKIYAFEYETGNYNKLCENISQEISLHPNLVEKIEAYPYGIWNCRENGWCEHFGESDGTQLVAENCGQLCKLDKLDSVLEKKKVTILKLDIEGAEIQGLEGAMNILKKQKPKLAICLYHRPEDLWEIPIFIKEINPKYEMIIRHHEALNYTDTVLYAK